MKYQPPDEFNAIAYPEFSCLDTMFFADIGSYPEVEKDLVEEIEAVLKIEFPDVTFDKRTICNQWRRVNDSKPFHAKTSKELADILRLSYNIIRFYHVNPTIILELKNSFGVNIISSRTSEAVDLFGWGEKTLALKKKNVSFACALVLLLEMTKKKLFSKYHYAIFLLLFKKILSDTQIVPFSYPIIREININKLAEYDLNKLNKIILEIINNVREKKNPCRDNFLGEYDKKFLGEENLKQVFVDHTSEWKHSDLYNSVKKLLELNADSCPEIILYFFEQVWVGNLFAGERCNSEYVTRFISDYNLKKCDNDSTDLFLFLSSIVNGLNSYSLLREKISNHEKLAKANKANPKKR